MKQPQYGTVAYCSLGHIGVITSHSPEGVTYPDGSEGVAWTGKKIWPFDEFGKPWSSRHPQIIGQIYDNQDGVFEYMG